MSGKGQLKITPWKNRGRDERSKVLERAWSFAIALLGSVIAVSIMLLFVGPEAWAPFPNKGWWPAVAILAFATYLLVFLWLMPRMTQFVFATRPEIVTLGHVGVVQFRGAYTGEIAESGRLLMPMGYTYELVDCRPYPYVIGPVDTKCADGFTIRAKFTANVKVSNPIAFLSTGKVTSLVTAVLTSALFGAIASREALLVVSDRNAMANEARAALEAEVAKFGLTVDYVSVDIVETPAELSDLLRMLSLLKQAYPEQELRNLAELLMVRQGKTTVSTSRNVNVLEVPGLEAVFKAAAERFGKAS